MAAVVVDAGDSGSTIVVNTRAIKKEKKNSLNGVSVPVVSHHDHHSIEGAGGRRK